MIWVLSEEGDALLDVQTGGMFVLYHPASQKQKEETFQVRAYGPNEGSVVTLFKGTRQACQDVLDQIAAMLKPWRFGYPGEAPKDVPEPAF